ARPRRAGRHPSRRARAGIRARSRSPRPWRLLPGSLPDYHARPCGPGHRPLVGAALLRNPWRPREGRMTEADRVAGLVDEERLARWMDEWKLPAAGERLTARFVSGGASNEIFEIRRGAARMALRRPPRLVPEGRNETMLREARVLAALRDSDVPHARLLGVCEDTSVLGACFYVMDWVEGWTPLGPLPEPYLSDATAKRGLGDELVDAIANL